MERDVGYVSVFGGPTEEVLASFSVQREGGSF
jgi:hypothetical protein